MARLIVQTALISLEIPDLAISRWLKKSQACWVGTFDMNYKIFTLPDPDMIDIMGLLALSLLRWDGIPPSPSMSP